MNPRPSIETAVIPQQTLAVMARTYGEAVAVMKSALEQIREAENRLAYAFGSGDRHTSHPFSIGDVIRARHGYVEPDKIELEWRQTAWRILVDRMELKRICSVKRANEIDAQLGDPAQLPEITEATMTAMIEGNVRSLADFLQEAVVECFDRLRPWHRGELGDGHKTNKVFQVGERVIIEYGCSNTYGGGRFHLSYSTDKTQMLRCLDNVMHLLDGRGAVPTHAGPLVDALNGEGNRGRIETDYFEAKCFKNQKVHLRFKRADLLAELNRRGSGGKFELPGQEKRRGTP